MRMWRPLAISVVVSAALLTGTPPAAMASTGQAGDASPSAASTASSPHRQRAWYDPFGWMGTDRAPAAKATTVSWTPPKVRSPKTVRVDPKAHRVRELTSRRTANASFYQLSDGRVQEVLSPSPVHYRDAKGAWQPISTTVGKVSHGAFTLGAQGNSFQTYFSGSPAGLLRVERGSAYVQMGADGAAAQSPAVKGDTVTFASALPGASLTYQVGQGGVREGIVLAKAPAAGTQYAFTLKVGGLTPVQRKDGSIAFIGGESGQAAFVIPAPYMADAHADANSPYGTSYSAKVTQRMSWNARTGTLRLTVTPDRAWLASSARQYPVTIDPSIVEAPPPSAAANVMISSDGPGTNYDTSWRLSAGTTTTGVARTLVRFPLPALPAGTTLTSATLNLYYDQYFTTGNTSVPLEAHAATAAWDPTTATWNSASGITGALAGTATKAAGVRDVWNHYTVTSTVQSWLNGTTTNNGFVIKAASESTLGQGGPRYEGSIYAYGGETETYPQLVLTYGVPGVAVNPPTVIHSTGAELSWPAYTNTTGDSGNDLAEYQVHRSWLQSFTPSASNEISPVPSGTTSFTDTTAQPTPASSTDLYGNAYYYMVAVKTKSGAIIPGPTQLVRLPKAGLTTAIIKSAAATTLSSAEPSTVLNTLTDTGLQQPWLEVGDNSSTYGTTRSVVDFGALPAGIPANSTVLDAHLKLWQLETDTTTSGASYEVRSLSRSFTGSQATWNSASTGTAWTSPGGDYGAADGTVSGLTNDPGRQTLDTTAIVQGWLGTPATNHGLEVKLAAETASSPQERTLFASPATADPALAPQLVVTYLAPASDTTYYAPATPNKMVPGTTYTVPVTLNNTTSATWAASSEKLTYHWSLPDGSDVTSSGNQIMTALPGDLAPGAQVSVNAQVTPPSPADTNAKGGYTLSWDMYNTATGTYLSGTAGGTSASSARAHAAQTTRALSPSAATNNGVGSLSQAIGVEEPGSNELGLESFYQYTTVDTGSGSSLRENASSGNTVWNYDAFSNPSRGFSTFVRLSYNSLDTTDTTTGFGWSVQASTPTRLGSPLDFHPNPNPTEVTFVDGDGTSHVFTWDSGSSAWTAPPGVHLHLEQLASCGPQVTNAQAWKMTRPDRTQFFYDCDGYPTAVVDKNGNEADFTYTARQSQNQPREFLDYITDPTGRKTLSVNYYAKGDSYSYDDGTGTLVSDTNLTNPAIIDHVKSITDIAGRTIYFYYTAKGLLAQLVDGYGTSAAKTFKFLYDATQGNKNVKLVQVTDPRGNASKLAYYDPPTDPKVHWWTQKITDRMGRSIGFAYAEPGTISGSAIATTVTDARNHSATYQLDDLGRPIQAVNALNQKTTLAWDGQNNVVSSTEDNGATTTWTYDPKTGYPLSTKDAEANKNNTAATTYTYQTSPDGYVADVTDKVSPRGSHWHFTYDGHGNLLTVQDPDGVAAGAGYTTSHTYDSYGDLLTTTDANNHTTTYSDYDPSGYPDTTKDPLGNVTTTAYGPRGEVTSTTDALGHVTTQNYDIFLRELDSKTPKDQANNVYITVPAPVYDANGNIVQSTAPNGAVTTATFDADDELTASDEPRDTSSAPARITTDTYDADGNLLTVTAPNGNVPGATAGSYTSTYAYDALNRAVSVTDALGDKSTVSFNDVGDEVSATDPVKNATAGNTTASTQTAYDLDHRPVTYTDADGNVSSETYDLDGNAVSAKDRNGNTTLYTYDADNRITEIQVPHTGSGSSITYDTSKYVYDQVGNQTQVISPRGVASGVAGAYTAVTKYDADNRKTADIGAYNPNDPVYNTAPETDYNYDAVGRTTQVSAPPSGGQSVRNVTKYSYWDNGWTQSSTDPFGITTSYDYDELGNQTSRTLTSAGGSSSRTQAWTYYPDGSLASRTDKGIPVGLQVALVDDSDVQNVTSTGTWQASSSGTGYNGYDYQTHGAGTGSDSFTWNLTIPQDGTYQVYVQYPQVSGASTTAQYTVAHDGGSSTQTVDQTKNAGGWVSLGSYPFTVVGSGQKISLAESAGGTVTADAVKLVRDNSKDTQPGAEAFTYSYDADGNTTQISDNSPNALYDTYTYGYDGVDRLTQLQEKLSGTVKHTTSFSYDPDSHPVSEDYDSSVSNYTYDNRNLLKTVVNKESAVDASPRTTSYTYTPTGQIATETKGNGNVVSYTYNLDDTEATQAEKTSGGTLVASDDYTYDPNGNPTQIVSSIQNADVHSSYVNNTATNTFTPMDQVASITNSDGKDNQSYTYDQEGNITSQDIGGATTSNTYDRNRLLTSDQNGTVGDYNYDPFGRLDTVTVDGTVEQRYSYDGYDRVTSEQQYSAAAAGLVTTNYVYDAFNRTVSQTDNAGTSSAKTTNFDYLATSNALVGESVNGTVTKTYEYSPWGERLDQVVHNSDGTEDPSYYSYDAHTNVQAITDSTGNTKSTYGYSAYGSDDVSQETGIDSPGAQKTGTGSDPYNDYRYTADRVDTSTGDYNMGFRNYDPGLNRFLSMDMYEGALSDAGLATDPYTGNRYAFAGGNPLSNIEMDGHSWLSDHGMPAFTVDSAGTVSRGPTAVDATMAALRDWAINETIRLNPLEDVENIEEWEALGTWVTGYDPVTKRYAVGRSSNPFGCAERDVSRKLGIPMDQIYFSRAKNVNENGKVRFIDVCRTCQNDSSAGQFSDGTKFYKRGRFEGNWPIHTDPLTEGPPPGKALVPVSKPSSSAASDAAGAGEDLSRAGGVLRGVSTAFKWAGRGLMVLGIAADIYDVATAPAGQKVQTAVSDTTSLAGAWAGAELGAEAGATIGTFIGGPVGTVVGGVVGGIAGGIIGGGLGKAAGDFFGSLF